MSATPQQSELAHTEDAFVFALLGLRSVSRRVERFVDAAIRGPARAHPAAARSGETVSPAALALLGALHIARGLAAQIDDRLGPREAEVSRETAAIPLFVPRSVAR
jgi:hypothetical protein